MPRHTTPCSAHVWSWSIKGARRTSKAVWSTIDNLRKVTERGVDARVREKAPRGHCMPVSWVSNVECMVLSYSKALALEMTLLLIFSFHSSGYRIASRFLSPPPSQQSFGYRRCRVWLLFSQS